MVFPDLIWNLKSGDRNIYLTFDDGPTPGVTDFVLENLKKYNAKGTFFCLGKNVKKYPDHIDRILQEGHSIGNHTFNHLNGWKTNLNTYLEDVKKCRLELEKRDLKVDLFRPPYGKISFSQKRALRGKYRVIMWGLLTKDYSNQYRSSFLLKKTMQNTVPGCIVVMHDSLKAEKNVRYILPRYLDYLKNNNFRMVGIN